MSFPSKKVKCLVLAAGMAVTQEKIFTQEIAVKDTDAASLLTLSLASLPSLQKASGIKMNEKMKMKPSGGYLELAGSDAELLSSGRTEGEEEYPIKKDRFWYLRYPTSRVQALHPRYLMTALFETAKFHKRECTEDQKRQFRPDNTFSSDRLLPISLYHWVFSAKDNVFFEKGLCGEAEAMRGVVDPIRVRGTFEKGLLVPGKEFTRFYEEDDKHGRKKAVGTASASKKYFIDFEGPLIIHYKDGSIRHCHASEGLQLSARREEGEEEYPIKKDRFWYKRSFFEKYKFHERECTEEQKKQFSSDEISVYHWVFSAKDEAFFERGLYGKAEARRVVDPIRLRGTFHKGLLIPGRVFTQFYEEDDKHGRKKAVGSYFDHDIILFGKRIGGFLKVLLLYITKMGVVVDAMHQKDYINNNNNVIIYHIK